MKMYLSGNECVENRGVVIFYVIKPTKCGILIDNKDS